MNFWKKKYAHKKGNNYFCQTKRLTLSQTAADKSWFQRRTSHTPEGTQCSVCVWTHRELQQSKLSHEITLHGCTTRGDLVNCVFNTLDWSRSCSFWLFRDVSHWGSNSGSFEERWMDSTLSENSWLMTCSLLDSLFSFSVTSLHPVWHHQFLQSRLKTGSTIHLLLWSYS